MLKRNMRIPCPHCEAIELWSVTDHLAPVQCECCQEWFIIRFIVKAETEKLYKEPPGRREVTQLPFQPDDDPLFCEYSDDFYWDVYDDLFDPYFTEDEEDDFADDLPLDEKDYY